MLAQKGATSGYYLTDALGSVTGLTDAAGNLTKTFRYDPYGNPDSAVAGSDVHFRYVGGYTDGGNLVHFGQRLYDPRNGRWTQPDPLDQTGSIAEGNGYAYRACNPVNRVDPSGLATQSTYCGFGTDVDYATTGYSSTVIVETYAGTVIAGGIAYHRVKIEAEYTYHGPSPQGVPTEIDGTTQYDYVNCGRAGGSN